MTNSMKMNRRAFVAAQAGVAAMGVSGMAAASTKPKWETLTVKELKPFIGEQFKVQCDCGLSMQLRLTETIAAKSGWARPANLRRREGVIAVFDSPQAEKFAENGDRSVRISHPELGSFNLFLGATPRRNGGFDIEAVLN